MFLCIKGYFVFDDCVVNFLNDIVFWEDKEWLVCIYDICCFSISLYWRFMWSVCWVGYMCFVEVFWWYWGWFLIICYFFWFRLFLSVIYDCFGVFVWYEKLFLVIELLVVLKWFNYIWVFGFFFCFDIIC